METSQEVTVSLIFLVSFNLFYDFTFKGPGAYCSAVLWPYSACIRQFAQKLLKDGDILKKSYLVYNVLYKRLTELVIFYEAKTFKMAMEASE